MLRRDRYRLLVAFNLACCAALFLLGDLVPRTALAMRWAMIGTAAFFLLPVGVVVFFWTADPFVPVASVIVNAFCWARLVDTICDRVLGSDGVAGASEPVSEQKGEDGAKPG